MLNYYALKVTKNQDKLVAIYKQYYSTMIYTAKSILDDYALAEDGVSEAFIKIINNFNKIKELSIDKTRAYIIIIVRNTAIDLLRQRKNISDVSIDDIDIPNGEISVLDNLLVADAYNNIIRIIQSLPKSLLDVLYLSVVLEHSYDEIASLLNISRNAVKMRLSRAKKEIRKKFNIEEDFL